MVRSRIDLAPDLKTRDGPAGEPRGARATASGGCDIYLAFAGISALHPAGYLVTGKSSVNDVVAFCPVDLRRMENDEDREREMSRQLRLAKKIAAGNDVTDEAGEVIWLGRLGADHCPAPHWIYGLLCMPLTRKWNGTWLHPVPFCPKMLAAMAIQPKAAAWFHARQRNASSGGNGS